MAGNEHSGEFDSNLTHTDLRNAESVPIEGKVSRSYIRLRYWLACLLIAATSIVSVALNLHLEKESELINKQINAVVDIGRAANESLSSVTQLVALPVDERQGQAGSARIRLNILDKFQQDFLREFSQAEAITELRGRGVSLANVFADYIMRGRSLVDQASREAVAWQSIYAFTAQNGNQFQIALSQLAEVLNREKLEFKEQRILVGVGSSFLIVFSIALSIIWIFQPLENAIVTAQHTSVMALKDALNQKQKLSKAKQKLESRNVALRELQHQSERQANTDALTGLLNRRGLERDLGKAIAFCLKHQFDLAVLHIDLDRFKQINDTLGHAAGDFVLGQVAEVLRNAAGSASRVARVGGDEFVILAVKDVEEKYLANMSQTIINALSEPVYYKDMTCNFGASIGIHVCEFSEIKDLETLDQLLVSADVALYHAKESGRGQYAFYTDEMHNEIAENRQYSDAVTSAVNNGEFVPFYQIQVSADSRRIHGVEALARWKRKDGSIAAPNQFIEMATSLRLMDKVDLLIIEAGLRDLERWREEGLDVPRLSFNLSPQFLEDRTFWERLCRLNPPSDRIGFEITEGVNFDDPSQQVMSNLLRLKAAGYALDIDDFGTKHASLLGLQKMAPDHIKISREVTKDIATSQRDREAVGGVVKIARAYRAPVVAEGIETQEQATVARNLGCTILQGYLYSKPVSAEDLRELLLLRSGTSSDGSALQKVVDIKSA